MVKIFSSGQIKEIDRFTIENEPISSANLMERAAGCLYEWIAARYDSSRKFLVFTGPGNNGGDGLVLARLLWKGGFNVEIFNIRITDKYSTDYILNRKRIVKIKGIKLNEIKKPGDVPQISSEDVIIDSIFGSGLTRAVEGLPLGIIKIINGSAAEIISVDMPSGMFEENNSTNHPDGIVHADYTLSFQFPKLAFMFSDCYKYTGKWFILSIGLHPEAISNTFSQYNYIEEKDTASVLKTRGKFDHKGNFGHGLFVAGSKSKTGAAILGARAALRTGIGLITCHTASHGASAILAALPEVMIQPDNNEEIITEIGKIEKYDAIGVGPGIGTDPSTGYAFKKLLTECDRPMVIDADAVNILGLNKKWLKLLPHNVILTPHKKEFERISGRSSDDYSRLLSQVEFSAKYKCIVILKGAFTSVSLPDGNVFFNNTGNPGMATAGSGDVLTGIILSLLAQGYKPADAALAGVNIHGLAGDIAAETLPYESVIASDIIDNIGNALKRIKDKSKKRQK